MNWKKITLFISGTVALLSLAVSPFANPTLTAGVWQNITPSGVNLSGTYGVTAVEMDPSNRATLYLSVDMQGLWKTTNAGESWTRLGSPPGTYNTTDVTYLDSPFFIRVDPNNPNHLYATQGVRGMTIGFWISNDAGASWDMPQGFITAATTTTRDVTHMDIDPTDFNHIIMSTHQSWRGVLESKDGGVTWILHNPIPEFNSGTMGVNFLYCPAQGIGNNSTWLVGTDGQGLWRTTNSGTSWTRVTPSGVWPDFSITHGGQSIFYALNGALYTGLFVYPARSTDNGLTWTMLEGFIYASYYTIQGDGNNMYTMRSEATQEVSYNTHYMTSAEDDGVTWTPYQGGAQKFGNGPVVMKYDNINGIMYSANWNSGLWALKVLDPGPVATSPAPKALARVPARVKSSVVLVQAGLAIRSATGGFYDVKGRGIKAR